MAATGEVDVVTETEGEPLRAVEVDGEKEGKEAEALKLLLALLEALGDPEGETEVRGEEDTDTDRVRVEETVGEPVGEGVKKNEGDTEGEEVRVVERVRVAV